MNVLNEQEIRDTIERIVNAYFDEHESKLYEKTLTWALSGYRRYALTKYPATQMRVASESTLQQVASFLSSIPTVCNNPDSHREMHALYKAQTRRINLTACSSATFYNVFGFILGTLPEFVKNKVSVVEDAPDWMADNHVYLSLNIEGLDDELNDLLDVITSDWFAPSLRSLNRMTVPQLQRKHERWVEELKIKVLMEESDEDKAFVCQLSNGFSVYELANLKARKREGAVMHHCLGGTKNVKPTTKYYSVRDADNKSILTLEGNVVKDKAMVFVQIRGFANRKVTVAEMVLLQTLFAHVNGVPCMPLGSIDTGESKGVKKLARARVVRLEDEEDDDREELDDEDEDDEGDIAYDEDEEDDEDEAAEDAEMEVMNEIVAEINRQEEEDELPVRRRPRNAPYAVKRVR